MYAVVTLQDSDEVMVVASNWLSPDKKQSYWPPFKSTEKCMEAVKNRLKPETGGKTWEKINISFHKDYGNGHYFKIIVYILDFYKFSNNIIILLQGFLMRQQRGKKKLHNWKNSK